MSLRMDVCRSCGHVVFPSRALCPACGSADWGPIDAHQGTAEQVTEWEGITIASIRSDLGPVVVVRCLGDLSLGAVVQLGADSSVPTASG